MNTKLAGLPRVLLFATAIAVLAAGLPACSTSGSTSSTGGAGHTHASAPKTKAKAASVPKATSALSGKWSGTYSGAYSGTFKLSWHQSGSHLHGTITISNPGSTLAINGTVHGTAITFGTVGSTAITYTGTVSGSSMSGTYKVGGASDSTGGPWSAAKS